MTTILSFLNQTSKSVFLVGDSQVTQENLRIPTNFSKIQIIGSSLLLASSGSNILTLPFHKINKIKEKIQ